MIERLKSSTLANTWERYSSADGPLYASAVAFNALFSIFPIILAVLFVASLALSDPITLGELRSSVVRFLPSDVAAEVVDVLRGTQEQAGLFGIISTIGLFWAGSSLFGSLAKGFNRIYGVPDRPLLREKLMSTAMILLFAVLLLISLASTVVAQSLAEFVDLLPQNLSGLVAAGSVLSFLLSLAAAIVLLLAIYWIVPNVDLSLQGVWRGAVVAGFLFVLLMQVFPLYVRLFAGFQSYGTLFGFSLLVLTWLYLVAQLLLLGAAFNAVGTPHALPRSTL